MKYIYDNHGRWDIREYAGNAKRDSWNIFWVFRMDAFCIDTSLSLAMCDISCLGSLCFGFFREAWDILEDFREEVQRGLRDRTIQRTPHFVLLDESFYHNKLKLHLARWTQFGLRALQFQVGQNR